MEPGILGTRKHLLLSALFLSACFNYRYMISILVDLLVNSPARDYEKTRIFGIICIYSALVVMMAFGIYLLIASNRDRERSQGSRSFMEKALFYCIALVTLVMPILIGKVPLPGTIRVTFGQAVAIGLLYLLLNSLSLLVQKRLPELKNAG